MQFNKYFFYALTSFIIWGFFSLAIKPLANYHSLDILFYRVFFSTTLLLIINLLFRKEFIKNSWENFKILPQKIKKQTILLTIGGGFLLVLNWFLFMYAVNHVSLQSASFAYLICPIITTVLAFLILKENINKQQWFAVILCIISCVILSYGHIKDLIYSLVIATSFALYLISQRKNNSFDKFIILTVQLVIAALVLLPFYPIYSGIIPKESLFYNMMALIVILFTIIPLYLNLFALKGMDSSSVGILMYTNPLIHFLLAIFYFNEPIQWTQIISYTLIGLSIIIFNMKMKKNA